MRDIRVIVATHKKYRMPGDSMYIPVHVGAEGKKSIGYQRDDQGENISSLNSAFCELTGLYWAWKNLDAEYIGLAHYRRHFKGWKKSKDLFEEVLTLEEANSILDHSDTDIILTKKRKYYIETIYDHYAHTMYVEPLDEAGRIIAEKYPEYKPYFDKHMKERSQHAFNMFIMRKDKLDAYCSWLFDILFELDKKFEQADYSAFHKRYPGRISERLLDVWLMKNNEHYVEVPFLYMEKINKIKKITGFLKAKLFHKKYGESCYWIKLLIYTVNTKKKYFI